MAGELDDPLLMASVPYGNDKYGDRMSAKMTIGGDDSSMGMNAKDDGDSMMSIGKIGVDDSELSNGIVGTTSKKAKTKSDKDKKVKNKDKKKKAKKSRRSDSDDDGDDKMMSMAL
jgi:hypothetical protein